MPNDTQKTVAGALLIGAGILSGNALLLTVAGGIGVNWSSEGLAGLWQGLAHAFAPATPLTRVGEQAIRRAVGELRRAYQQETGPHADMAAFDLVQECAAAVAQAQYPASPHDPLAARLVLAASLDELLYGHAAQQFLKDRLLDAVAIHFRSALAADQTAWHFFYGWLLERLNTQLAALQPSLARLPDVLAQLQDQSRAAAALAAAAAPLQEALDELRAAIHRLDHEPPSGAVTFTNSDVRVGGDLEQAGGDIHRGGSIAQPAPAGPRSSAGPVAFNNQGVEVNGNLIQAGGNSYNNSAHAEGPGAQATVNNRPSPLPPQARPAAPPPSADEPLALMLTVAATDQAVHIRWECDAIGVCESRFSAPYHSDDLALVVRALDSQQRQAFSFTAAEQARLAALDLWDSAGRPRTDLARRVGRALHDALTADLAAAKALATVRDYATASARPLALLLRFPPHAVELAALPWELLWPNEPTPLLFSRGAVASCTRHIDLAQALPPAHPRQGALRILAIAPHAGIAPAVRQNERAARMIAWQPLIDSGQVQMAEVSPATRPAVMDAIHRQQPDVIHYYGHGRYRAGHGELQFDDPSGGPSWIGGDPLTTLFGGTHLVVLHACQGAMVGDQGDAGLLTGIAPALSAAGVPLVIGMQLTVRIPAATRASAVIYAALASGRSVQVAVNRARQALYVEEADQSSWYVPVLYICSREAGPAYL
jgi:CHAT domain